MTDQEREVLNAFRSKWSESMEYVTISDSTEITDDQMQVLCKYGNDMDLAFKYMLMTHPKMNVGYLDLMLDGATIGLSGVILERCKFVQARHIDLVARKFLLPGKCSPKLFDDIIRHPACTDAMKVKYHLLRG